MKDCALSPWVTAHIRPEYFPHKYVQQLCAHFPTRDHIFKVTCRQADVSPKK